MEMFVLSVTLPDGGEKRRRPARRRHGIKFARRPLAYGVIATGLTLSLSATAKASQIDLAVIGTHEYDIPTTDYKPFDIFVQYGDWNSDDRSWNDDGKKSKGPGTDTFVGLSRYVHFWTVDSLPGVGFAFDMMIPEVRVDGHSRGVGGIADPLTGGAVFFKPTANTTLGFQNFFKVPIGDKDVSDNYWASLASILYAWHVRRMTFNGHTGFEFRGKQHLTGQPDLLKDTIFHSSMTGAIRISKRIEPYAEIDYQKIGADRIAATRQFVPDSATNELTVGGGVSYTLSQKMTLQARYSKGLKGRNTTVTDAVYIRVGYHF